jgi:hypothetical protein
MIIADYDNGDLSEPYGDSYVVGFTLYGSPINDIPTNRVALSPDEARLFALKLIKAADAAEAES